jgi:hypothetical protein
MVLPPRGVSEVLETASCNGHEFRNCRQIPIRIGDLGMADVGGESEHGVVDTVCTLPAFAMFLGDVGGIARVDFLKGYISYSYQPILVQLSFNL